MFVSIPFSSKEALFAFEDGPASGLVPQTHGQDDLHSGECPYRVLQLFRHFPELMVRVVPSDRLYDA